MNKPIGDAVPDSADNQLPVEIDPEEAEVLAPEDRAEPIGEEEPDNIAGKVAEDTDAPNNKPINIIEKEGRAQCEFQPLANEYQHHNCCRGTLGTKVKTKGQ